LFLLAATTFVQIELSCRESLQGAKLWDIHWAALLFLQARMVHVPKRGISLTTEFVTTLQMCAKMANAKVPFALTMASHNVHAVRWDICVKCVVILLWYVLIINYS
jgi:hypothetical protein